LLVVEAGTPRDTSALWRGNEEFAMGRRHDESTERENAARDKQDAVEEDTDDPEVEPDNNLIGNPMPPATKEYIDLEIARIQPPA
jgi:hypothetical protein